jgi:hypothetical protein
LRRPGDSPARGIASAALIFSNLLKLTPTPTGSGEKQRRSGRTNAASGGSIRKLVVNAGHTMFAPILVMQLAAHLRPLGEVT